MSVWSGWQADLLNAAAVPNTADNRAFLTDWHNHATHDCTNNPVDLKHAEQGSTVCVRVPNGSGWQNYANHTTAGLAFKQELNSGNYPGLLAAIKSGHPYKSPNPNQVAADLVSWGSSGFSVYYSRQVSSGAGGGSTVTAPHLHGGWNALRRTMNRQMPAAVKQARRDTSAALRTLHRGRRVRT